MTALSYRVKNRAFDLLFNPLLDSYWMNRLRGTVTCLLYHRVEAPGKYPFLDKGGCPVISPRGLERDLRFLMEKGVSFYTFRDLREGKFPGSDEVGYIVSFDDCFACNYAEGLDVLGRLGIPAVFFQTSGMIASPGLLWEHALYWLVFQTPFEEFREIMRRRAGAERLAQVRSASEFCTCLIENVDPQAVEESVAEAAARGGYSPEMKALASAIYPSAEQIAGAHASGHEIGSHGHRHYRRANIDAVRFEAELAESVRLLTGILNHPPGVFSYPFGSCTENDRDICSRFFPQAALVGIGAIAKTTGPYELMRHTWPGAENRRLRNRRWILTGEF